MPGLVGLLLAQLALSTACSDGAGDDGSGGTGSTAGTGANGGRGDVSTGGGSGTGATAGSGADGGGGSGGDGATGGGGGTGGDGAGGSVQQTCDDSAPVPEPPADVADWINESWDAQLGDNIESREAWLLDSVIKGEGQINLCVRWGATTPPSATVKSQLASSVEEWFNDWFRALGDHDCFPYGDGITTKITGWAVKPGNESWVSDLGPDVKVYTQTDGEGEPKCPDACSFFSNWDHDFSACPDGEAFHTDYWIWVDDQLPGGGGAAAVGGDWGLRMPLAGFVNALGKSGSNVLEHEIGHGFGFQDYYDWTGSEPAGGSLMIVGSQGGGEPSVGDTWLLRRTWSESKALRGW